MADAKSSEVHASDLSAAWSLTDGSAARPRIVSISAPGGDHIADSCLPPADVSARPIYIIYTILLMRGGYILYIMTDKNNKLVAINNTPKSNSYHSSPVIGDNLVNCNSGDLAKITKDALTIAFWDPIDTTDPDQLKQRTIDYLNYCIDNDIRPGNMGLYSAWGLSRQAVHQTISRGASSARLDIMQKSLQIMATIRESLMSGGKINPVTGIFWQKNFDGLTDTQSIEITPNVQQQPQYSNEDLLRMRQERREIPQKPDLE